MASESSRSYARVERLLGAESLRIRNPLDLHERVAKGLPRRMMVRLVDSLTVLTPLEILAALNVSARTWHRIKAGPSGSLDADQSARVWSLAEVLSKAEDNLGSREDAERWLASPAIGLGSKRPIDLMATPQGAEIVRTFLDRMTHGVYA